MSTLLSTDMHIKRSTTRLHAPPGGQTTIDLSGYPDEPSTPRVPRSKTGSIETSDASQLTVSIEEVTTKLSAVSISLTPEASHTVSVVIAGSKDPEAVKTIITKALVATGIAADSIAVLEIEDVVMLPYIVKRVATKHDFQAILAVAIFASEASLNDTLVGNLLQTGMESGVPVIPGVVTCGSLLEMKALVATNATTWARSLSTVLSPTLSFVAPPEVPPPKPACTPETDSLEHLLDDFREHIKQHGARGIFGLARLFKIADDDNSGFLSLSEFTKCVNEHGLEWTPAQIQIVFTSFDKHKSGTISYDDFLVGVRGGLNPRRHQLVLLAFEILDKDKSGVVTVDDIRGVYDGSKHPDVLAGRRTNEDILREFLDTFDGDAKDGEVTVTEFCDYYGNLSASIDEDDYFELMIRNAWHISGGEGWCENSSCRRVLVTHTDGRQTVEEIKNDLGIKAGDKEAMKAKLIEQGVTDIMSIDTTGSTSDSVGPPPSPTKGGDAGAAAAGVRTTSVAGSMFDQSRPATAPATANPRRVKGAGASSIVLG